MATPEEEYRYLAIDLKSFYASVECADRGLDPFSTHLVVADPSRGPGTICLAVSPALKAHGCPSRPRVRDIPSNLRYLMVRPRMRRYMEVSSQIVSIYLRRISPDDLHVYSVDECFIDTAPYLRLYDMTPRELSWALMADVERETKICATAGLGTNLFLSKVALDLIAKHESDHTGVLDEEAFRRRVWHHRPITDIWGIASGTARRLLKWGARDLHGVTRIPPNELRSEFGVTANTLIDHAWGRESCTLSQIKSYEPKGHSISNGQVLMRDYAFEEALVVLREMTDASALQLVGRGEAASGISVWCGYAWDDLAGAPGASAARRLPAPTDSREALWDAVSRAWREVVDPSRPVRRVGIALTGLVGAESVQAPLFGPGRRADAERALARAEARARARFGSTAVFRGVDLRPCATGLTRAEQVGGHHE